VLQVKIVVCFMFILGMERRERGQAGKTGKVVIMMMESWVVTMVSQMRKMRRR
jgi:hypothetical protein